MGGAGTGPPFGEPTLHFVGLKRQDAVRIGPREDMGNSVTAGQIAKAIYRDGWRKRRSSPGISVAYARGKNAGRTAGPPCGSQTPAPQRLLDAGDAGIRVHAPDISVAAVGEQAAVDILSAADRIVLCGAFGGCTMGAAGKVHADLVLHAGLLKCETHDGADKDDRADQD